MADKIFREKIKLVNDFLKQYEEKGNYTHDHKGYSGYKPQWVIDAVNKEFQGQWGIEVIKMIVQPKEADRKFETGLVQVRVTFYNNGESRSVDAIASHPSVQGDIGDALKSAQTDAMKKAFAHFSIGNRAYHGLLPKKK
tara:strand:- start:260 stop:676 length:417 start_codon:yes stop_codon:yes gene_type:complete